MGASSASPRARQARSPKDKPRKRVRVTRSPAVLAWSGVKAIASRIGLRVASQASRGLIPLSTSLLCTSARLTVLLTPLLSNSGVNFSAPDSRFSTVSSAEASRTILFTLGCLAALRNQFVDQRGARFHVLANKPLRSLEPALPGGDPQFI